MSYDITLIPGIMRKKGWTNGAALMDRWFSLPANNVPTSGSPDTTTITMSWVLSYSRAKVVYDEIVNQRIWVNAAGKKQIQKWLTDEGKLAQKDIAFGGPMYSAISLEANYIQARVVGGLMDPLDDMYAALGRFSFRVAVAGKVTFDKKTSKHKISIEEVGIYVRDSYDYNGDQPLGHWSDEDVYRAPIPIVTTAVGNIDFRNWRDANQKGGDFIVYSDVRVLKRTSPDTFEI